jgi:hypothetical protein
VIEHGQLKIAFDPLFRNDYGQYERVPANIETAFMAGTAPWDGMDAGAIRALVADPDDAVLNRVHGVAIENGAPPIEMEFGPLLIEAFRIPHAGWPGRHNNVENIVFRVTLDDETTVMHFGDADPNDEHFAKDPEHWKERHTHFAMPPYWFFYTDEGRQIIEDRIDASHTIGVHVPKKIPDDPESRPERLQGYDLFTHPGETRTITVTD